MNNPIKTMLVSALALTAAPAFAQETPPSPPTTATVTTPVVPPTTTVTPIAPPATVVTPVGPNAVAVKEVPGVVAVTTKPGVAVVSNVKIETFADFDVNNDGSYSPMEFAEAMQFLATAKVAQPGSLPSKDKYKHKGTTDRMPPERAIAMLNTYADELAMVDSNRDWRVSPEELRAVAMM